MASGSGSENLPNSLIMVLATQSATSGWVLSFRPLVATGTILTPVSLSTSSQTGFGSAPIISERQVETTIMPSGGKNSPGGTHRGAATARRHCSNVFSAVPATTSDSEICAEKTFHSGSEAVLALSLGMALAQSRSPNITMDKRPGMPASWKTKPVIEQPCWARSPATRSWPAGLSSAAESLLFALLMGPLKKRAWALYYKSGENSLMAWFRRRISTGSLRKVFLVTLVDLPW